MLVIKGFIRISLRQLICFMEYLKTIPPLILSVTRERVKSFMYFFQILQQIRILVTELCGLSDLETPDELLILDEKLDERVCMYV